MRFDLLAPYYRWMEWVLAGSKLQRCRTAWLHEVETANRILLLGEGHGRFLAEARRLFPQAHITVLDSSGGMLQQARKRLSQPGEQGRIRWAHCNVFDWPGDEGQFDLLVTNFFLDCFTEDELEVLIRKCARWLKPGGRWLIADFQQPRGGLARARAAAILWVMYRFFRVVTKLSASQLACPDATLRENGFVLQKRRETEWGLLRSDLWLWPGLELAGDRPQRL